MGEYHKTIDDLQQEFEDLQISKIMKQVNVINTDESTSHSVGDNPGSRTLEQE